MLSVNQLLEHTAPLFNRLKIFPVDQLINLCILRFMHSFTHNLLPLSFPNIWTSNRERQPERVLRNADQLFIPRHNFATLKRLPLFSFPAIWNMASDEKNDPNPHRYVKYLKRTLLLNLN